MKSKIHLRKVSHYHLEEVESFVRATVDLFNDQDQPIAAGQKVLLKPNILRGAPPEKCITTHPVVLEAVCRVLSDAGVKQIDISDSPVFGSLRHGAEKAGYGPLP